MKEQKERKLEEIQSESIKREAWQTPEVKVLPVPDLTKGGAGLNPLGDAPGAPDYKS